MLFCRVTKRVDQSYVHLESMILTPFNFVSYHFLSQYLRGLTIAGSPTPRLMDLLLYPYTFFVCNLLLTHLVGISV